MLASPIKELGLQEWKGSATQLLVDKLQQCQLSDVVLHALELVLAVPYLVVECHFNEEGVGGTSVIAPSNCFREAATAAIAGDLERVMGVHAELMNIRREREDRIKGVGCIRYRPDNDRQRTRQLEVRTLDEKLNAALVVAMYGAEHCSSPLLLTLMWPLERFDISDAKDEARQILLQVLGQSLDPKRHQDSDLILQASAERMEVLKSDQMQ